MPSQLASALLFALRTQFACVAVLCMLVTGLAQAKDAETKKKDGKLYELRIYTTNPGKLRDLHARFRDHTLSLFEKHGMENIIYWNVSEGARGEE